MDEMFTIHDHWEKDGSYYIKTDFGELNTKNKEHYDMVIEDGFIVIKIDDYPEGV